MATRTPANLCREPDGSIANCLLSCASSGYAKTAIDVYIAVPMALGLSLGWQLTRLMMIMRPRLHAGPAPRGAVVITACCASTAVNRAGSLSNAESLLGHCLSLDFRPAKTRSLCRAGAARGDALWRPLYRARHGRRRLRIRAEGAHRDFGVSEPGEAIAAYNSPAYKKPSMPSATARCATSASWRGPINA